MAKCLGLYVEDNIIKYAKVSKEHNDIKVETFGVKFYDKLDKAIDKIIEETYSQKTPISINLSEENYNYFHIFSLLSRNDLQKAVKTEFETYCEENGYNPNVFESRYAVVDEQNRGDKLKIIYVTENKLELNKKTQALNGYKIASISPLPMTLPNLIGDKLQKNENALIVNIEQKTTITKIINGKIENIDTLEEGSADFLTKLNLKENSYSKAYEICKNTTIYTSAGKELQTQETESLDDIMPTLYTIVNRVKEIIEQNTEKIEKVYINGTGAVINNVDIYFQEYLDGVKCEILKPYFINNTKELSIKDYQEVNTAISLGLMGLGEGIAGMNFKRKSFSDSIPDWLKIEITPDAQKQKKNGNQFSFFINDLGQKLDKTELGLIRIAIALFLLAIIYTAFSGLLSTQMDKKQEEAKQLEIDTNTQISLANADNKKLMSRTNEYTQLIKDLEAKNDKIADRNKTRNAIPDLLNQLMYIIPENVQITGIENITGTKIVISAQSYKYEQLGYFTAKIKTESILTNVISTAGEKENKIVTIRIEGDLP